MFWLSTVIRSELYFYFCFPGKLLVLYCITTVAGNKVQLNYTVICILYFFKKKIFLFFVLFQQLSSCLQIGRNPFDIIRSERMFSSFPSSDPPPPRANRIPPRMRAATGSLQMQLHREQGLTGWNKLDRGRSLNNLPGSRPPGSMRKHFGWSSERHLVELFRDIFLFLTFVVSTVWRR